AHRPGRHLDLPGYRVVDRLHDAALGKRCIVHQLERVEYGACRNAGGTEQLHCLFLAVLPGKVGDERIDLCAALAARLLGVVTRITAEILAADDLEQALPMLRVGTAAEDIPVIVRPAGLARVKRTGREPAGSRSACAAAHHRSSAELSAGERH